MIKFSFDESRQMLYMFAHTLEQIINLCLWIELLYLDWTMLRLLLILIVWLAIVVLHKYYNLAI